jgi:hypothetical protein
LCSCSDSGSGEGIGSGNGIGCGSGTGIGSGWIDVPLSSFDKKLLLCSITLFLKYSVRKMF